MLVKSIETPAVIYTSDRAPCFCSRWGEPSLPTLPKEGVGISDKLVLEGKILNCLSAVTARYPVANCRPNTNSNYTSDITAK